MLWEPCVWLAAPEKNKNSPLFPHQSPVGNPVSCTLLRNRVFIQTNAYHLCTFPNTWSDSKPNRLMRKKKRPALNKQHLFSRAQGKQFSLAEFHGKAKTIRAQTYWYLYWIQCKELPCVPLCATNLNDLYSLQHDHSRAKQNGTINSKTQPVQ